MLLHQAIGGIVAQAGVWIALRASFAKVLVSLACCLRREA
jgi:hypothetical protein